MYGKILVIKSILLPKITYLLQNLSPTKQILSDLNSLFFKFLWNKKKDKIKRTITTGHKQDGGLNMIDIKLFYKSMTLKWVKYLKSEDNANWKVIPNFFLNQYGKHLLIFNMNIDSLKSLHPPKIKLPRNMDRSQTIEIWQTMYCKNF